MENKKAKELFFHFDGQKFFMEHDGMFDEYKKYGINENMEKEWEEELILLRLNEYKKSSKSRYLIPLVEYYNKYELIDELLKVKPNGNLLNKITIVELLTKLLCKNRNKIDNYDNYRNTVIQFCNNIKSENNMEEIEKRYEVVMKKLNVL